MAIDDLPGTSPWAVEQWISEDALHRMEYSDYWNDEHAEREKPFYTIDDNDFSGLERYLRDVGLIDDAKGCLGTLATPLHGRGIDLAAGTLWACPLLLGAGRVQRLYCLEYSRHRLLKLGPRVLEHYDVDPERVVLVYGSFYELHLEAGSLDFAFMSQAFHHADRPLALLGELRRVLKPGGIVIIIGEHVLRPRDYALYAARAAASLALPRSAQRRSFGHELDVRLTMRPTAADIMPTDPTLGDHAYSAEDYRRMFTGAGFAVHTVRRPHAHYQSFVLERSP